MIQHRHFISSFFPVEESYPASTRHSGDKGSDSRTRPVHADAPIAYAMTMTRHPDPAPFRSPMTRPLAALGLALALAGLAPDDSKSSPKDSAVGSSYKVPYRLTQTNHYLVRVRLNGKGPFNFLVDTGAPALYVGTEAAKAVGLITPEDDFWAKVETLDFEGGATLAGVKARVEDPFQLVGMNALGLPGAKIDGILGFTILARFRLEMDPTLDRMTWTKLDYAPPDPPTPPKGAKQDLPAEMQIMQAAGPMMKFASIFLGKQPEEQLSPRGFLGLELKEVDDGVNLAAIAPGSPAERAGLKPGDSLIRLAGKRIGTRKAAHEAVKETKIGDKVAVVLRRNGETIDATLTASEGF